MIKQRQFLHKNKTRIDLWFIGILVISILLLGVYYGEHTTYKGTHSSYIVPLDLPPEKYSYDNFWHRFNTYSVVMINILNKDQGHLVSQFEVDAFQNKFFKDLDLENKDKIITHSDVPVNPDTLFCYMKLYGKDDPKDIIKSCRK